MADQPQTYFAPWLLENLLVDFCELLTNDLLKEERLHLAVKLRSDFQLPHSAQSWKRKFEHHNLGIGPHGYKAETSSPYTTATAYKEVFNASHPDLFDTFGRRAIHTSVIRNWWESRNDLLAGDLEYPKEGSQDIRWWSIIGNAIKTSNVFEPAGKRGHYRVTEPPSSPPRTYNAPNCARDDASSNH